MTSLTIHSIKMIKKRPVLYGILNTELFLFSISLHKNRSFIIKVDTLTVVDRTQQTRESISINEPTNRLCRFHYLPCIQLCCRLSITYAYSERQWLTARMKQWQLPNQRYFTTIGRGLHVHPRKRRN